MTAPPPEQKPNEQQDIREMAKVVSAALAKRKTKQEIVEELIRAGWSEESAKGFVRRALPR
jgi:hypothetical protein